MRIAMVTETWRPSVDGVVTRLDHTVRDLAQRGHEVLVMAPTRGDPISGVTQRRTLRAVVPPIDRSRRWGCPDPRIRRMVADFAPAVVHVVNPVLMGSVAVRDLAGRYPLVASLHTDLDAYAARYHLGLLRPILRQITRTAYAQADVALATSATGLRLLRELNATRGAIWPPGVDRSVFAPRAGVSPPPSTPGLQSSGSSRSKSQTLHVVSVGRLAREKSFDLLRPVLDAAEQGSNTHLTLELVGDGPDRPRLMRLFAGTPTTFTGLLRGAELASAYRSADVVAFTSATETVGLVLLEAVAMDLAIVAVDTPATRDTLAGYPRAVLVPPSAAPAVWLAAFGVARTAVHTGEVDETSATGRNSWAHSTDVLLDAYGEALLRFQAPS